MIDINDIDRLQGATAVDRDGDRLGRIGQVYVSDDGREPLFVTVHTGLFGTKESFVPLQGADLDNDTLRLQYDKATIKDAPNIADDGALSDDEQGTIYDYYDGHAGGSASGTGGTTAGIGSGTTGTDTTRTDTTGTGTGTGTADYDTTGTGTAGYGTTGTGTTAGDDTEGRHAAGRDTVGHDTSGPTTDDAMTRSEERLNAGVQQVQTGRAKLRKHVVTERQTVNVPVSHEEARLEREPITDANRGDAYDGPDLSDEEHEVVLTEERPVVEKETVPVERVRLATEKVTENQQVTEDVRHEEIEQVDGTTGTGRTDRS